MGHGAVRPACPIRVRPCSAGLRRITVGPCATAAPHPRRCDSARASGAIGAVHTLDLSGQCLEVLPPERELAVANGVAHVAQHIGVSPGMEPPTQELFRAQTPQKCRAIRQFSALTHQCVSFLVSRSFCRCRNATSLVQTIQSGGYTLGRKEPPPLTWG